MPTRYVACSAKQVREERNVAHQVSFRVGGVVMLPLAAMTAERTRLISSARHTTLRESSCQRTERCSSGFATPVSTDAHSAPLQACPLHVWWGRHWLRTHIPVSVAYPRVEPVLP